MRTLTQSELIDDRVQCRRCKLYRPIQRRSIKEGIAYGRLFFGCTFDNQGCHGEILRRCAQYIGK